MQKHRGTPFPPHCLGSLCAPGSLAAPFPAAFQGWGQAQIPMKHLPKASDAPV